MPRAKKKTRVKKRISVVDIKTNLAEQLKQGALANSRRDLAIAREWFSLDEAAAQGKS